MSAVQQLRKIHDWLWEIPKDTQRGMRVPARVYTSESMLKEISQDRSLHQLTNVATLPGIEQHALAMPDVHEGYGFPVGGVAAFDTDEGVISPGGIGYDINCGVRLLASSLSKDDLKGRERELAHSINREIPSGVGRGGRIRLNADEVDSVLEKGCRWALSQGYARKEDLEHIESGGYLDTASADDVSDLAKKRGRDQLGTLGAGNHFLEVLVVDEVFDSDVGDEWGITKDQVVFMIHTGSRGLGHQIATDYVRIMMSALRKYKIELADRELACAPFRSKEGQRYFSAMSAGANFAWANRQVITAGIRRVWEHEFGPKDGNLELIYDVAHNIAKVETHMIDGNEREVVVHRKGATRAFPGQPVIIPGSMGTASYLLVGAEGSMRETFGSSCHGAGRRMSRSRAKKEVRGEKLQDELEKKGIFVESRSYGLIAEEAPTAYKDVEYVVEVVGSAGIACKVARMVPVIVVIG